MFNFIKKNETIGQQGERLAREEYQRRGFKILETNVFNRYGKQFGEIDFIATKSETLYFIEVKTRSTESSKFGTGVEAVNRSKQLKILKAVKLYLAENKKYQSFRPQIDVCVVVLPDLDKPPKSVIIISNAVEDRF